MPCLQLLNDSLRLVTGDGIVLVIARRAGIVQSHNFAVGSYQRPTRAARIDRRIVLNDRIDRSPVRLSIRSLLGDNAPREGILWITERIAGRIDVQPGTYRTIIPL